MTEAEREADEERWVEGYGEPLSMPTASLDVLPAHIDDVRRMQIRRWANRLRGRYGVPIYLCGSALHEDNADPRDWDFRITVSDEAFAVMFGPVTDWNHEGNTGEWGRTRFRWSAQCVKDTKDAWARLHLNADVQIYPESYASAHYADLPRVRVDSFPEGESDV